MIVTTCILRGLRCHFKRCENRDTVITDQYASKYMTKCQVLFIKLFLRVPVVINNVIFLDLHVASRGIRIRYFLQYLLELDKLYTQYFAFGFQSIENGQDINNYPSCGVH